MPGAKTHDAIALASSVVIAPISYMALAVRGDTPIEAAAGAGLLIGAHLIGSFWLSPDLDIDSAIDNRWGPLFWIWRPYMWAVPHRHRIFSHSGISGLLRIAYLYLIVCLMLITAMLLATWFGATPSWPAIRTLNEWVLGLIINHPREAGLIAIGIVLSDLIHTATDHVSTFSRRQLRAIGLRGRRR